MKAKSVDLRKVERVLSGNIAESELNADELLILRREKPMFAVGRMAELAAQGYYAHAAAIAAARSAGGEELVQTFGPNQPVPTEVVVRKNGTTHIFDSHYYLERLGDPDMGTDLASVWLVGALLKVGDALSRHDYFDHGPDLELVYHLRNGVAHGNRFNITEPGRKRLARWPAHNRTSQIRVPGADFEITSTLNGSSVLFDFMGPGDLLDLLQSIAVRFMRLRDRLA